jgi:hypothetical protein
MPRCVTVLPPAPSGASPGSRCCTSRSTAQPTLSMAMVREECGLNGNPSA